MTATPSETHEAALSDERLREIIDGCEGVTPGPWMVASDLPAYAIMALKPDGTGGHRLVQTPNQNNYRHFGPSNGWDGIQSITTAEHIARLDPNTVRALATELLARRTQPSAGEVVVGPTVEQVARNLCGEEYADEDYNGRDVQMPDNAPMKRWELYIGPAKRVMALYATPPDQSRVERLEAAAEAIIAAAKDTRGWLSVMARELMDNAVAELRQALHGDRS